MLLRGLRAASRKATALYDDAVAPVDLNIAQFSLLRKIERDAHGVSFVSVTQSFNTTTSMGRLTLNVLRP